MDKVSASFWRPGLKKKPERRWPERAWNGIICHTSFRANGLDAIANSASEALKFVAATIEQSLILILSDINIPGLTGFEMLPRVKEMRPDVIYE